MAFERNLDVYQAHNISVNERNIRYYRAGNDSNQALLFLHGSGPGVTALANWRGAITRLGDEFDCIAPDVLGFGDSFHPEELLDAETMLDLRVESVAELVRKLGLEQVDLVGNSMGGRISILLLIRYPELFRRVTLMGSGVATNKVPTTLSRVRNFYDQPTKDVLREIFTGFLYDPTALGDLDKMVDERFAIATREDVRRSHLSSNNNGPVPVDLDLVRTIQAPVSLMHGREDRVVDPGSTLKLLEILPHADAHILGGCGHWLQLEKAREFDALIRTFHGAK